MSPVAIQVSPEVAEFLKWISGEEWPGLNEDRLFGVSQAYLDAATGLTSELAPIVIAAVNAIRANFDGAGERAFAASMARFVNEEPRYLFVAAEELAKAAEGARKTGQQVQYVKLIIILTIVELMIELAVAAAMAFINPAFLAWFAARSAIVRYLIQSVIWRLINAVVTNMVMGIAFQVAMDFLAQRIQIDILHTRDADEWDWELTRQSVEVGALGGAVSWAGGLVGNAFVKTLLKRAPDGGAGWNVADGLIGTPSPKDGLVPTPSGRNTKPLVELFTRYGMEERVAKRVANVFDLSNEAGVEWFTEFLYGGLTGQGWEASPFALTSGLVSGFAGMIGHKGGVQLGGSYSDFRADVRKAMHLDPDTGAFLGFRNSEPMPIDPDSFTLHSDSDSDSISDAATLFDHTDDTVESVSSTIDSPISSVSVSSTTDSSTSPVSVSSTIDSSTSPVSVSSTIDSSTSPVSVSSTIDSSTSPVPVSSTIDSSTSPVRDSSTIDSSTSPVPDSSTTDSSTSPVPDSTDSLSVPPEPSSDLMEHSVLGQQSAQSEGGMQSSSGSHTLGLTTPSNAWSAVLPTLAVAMGTGVVQFGTAVMIPSRREGESDAASEARWVIEQEVAQAIQRADPEAVLVFAHATKAGFEVGGETLNPSAFARRLARSANLKPGKPVVLVACDAAKPISDVSSPGGTAYESQAAEVLAGLAATNGITSWWRRTRSSTPRSTGRH